MEKIMAILTKEKKYSERLCDFINRKNNLIFTAVPFDDAAQCSDFSKSHNVELLLADSEFVGNGSPYMADGRKKNEIKAARTLKFAEGYSFDRALAESAGGSYTEYINKYQPAETLLRDVMNRCDGIDFVNAAEAAGRPVRIIGVYSPVSRCGKSSFALTLSRILSKNRKTLYMDLEEFSGMESITGENYTVCLSDALYHMKQGSLNAQKIYSMVYSFCGVDYIPPIRYADDRNALSGDDYVQLINTILKNTMYEVLVIDMDRFADEASDIMEICSIVYMPVLDNYIDKIKVQNFLDYLNSSGRERMAEKIVQIKTPEPDIVPKGSSYIDALMYGAMGDMIRDLKEG